MMIELESGEDVLHSPFSEKGELDPSTSSELNELNEHRRCGGGCE